MNFLAYWSSLKLSGLKNIAASIFLLFLLVAPITSSFIFLHYQKKQVRKEVKRQIIAGIDRDGLVLLKFSKDEAQDRLQWIHGREFIFNGYMYDIVEVETTGGQTNYWCWPDSKETKLNKQLDDLLMSALGRDMKSKEKRKQLTHFYQNLYCLRPFDWDFSDFRSEKTERFCKRVKIAVSFPPPVPPPETT